LHLDMEPSYGLGVKGRSGFKGGAVGGAIKLD
jgi:hypothetical protein